MTLQILRRRLGLLSSIPCSRSSPIFSVCESSCRQCWLKLEVLCVHFRQHKAGVDRLNVLAFGRAVVVVKVCIGQRIGIRDNDNGDDGNNDDDAPSCQLANPRFPQAWGVAGTSARAFLGSSSCLLVLLGNKKNKNNMYIANLESGSRQGNFGGSPVLLNPQSQSL